MRIKFKEKANAPKLEFGKTYDIVLTTCAWKWRFTFTRKSYVYAIELNESTPMTKSFKIHKKNLKRMLNDKEFTEQVVEIE